MQGPPLETLPAQAPESRAADRLAVVFYLLHLLLPACLLLDIAIARFRGYILWRPFFPHTFAAVVIAAWLAAGLVFLLAARKRKDFAARVSTPLLGIYTIYVGLAGAEMFGRWLGLAPHTSALQPPLTRAIAHTPGTDTFKKFTINPLGLRGPMPPKDGYRIVAVGGSTTICPGLDDSEVWTQVLMSSLNIAQKSLPVWVGNTGANGAHTINHQVLLQWLPGILRFDMIIFLTGGNDLNYTLTFNGASTQKYLERQAGFAGDLPDGMRSRVRYPIYTRLRLFTLIEAGVHGLKQRLSGPTQPRMADFRRRRAAAPVVPLPDLAIGLREYRGRILKLVNQCRALNVRCLFLTQPALWRADLSPAENGLLWTGNVGPMEHPLGYVSAADMARAIDMYNRTLLDVCRESGAECLDLVPTVPKSTAAFADDIHWNANGANMMAQTLKDYLLSRPPLHPAPTLPVAASR